MSWSGWVGNQVGKNELDNQAQRVAVSRTYSTRRLVRRHQGSDLGSVPFDVFVQDLDKATECLCVKFTEEPKLGGPVDIG